MANEFKIKNGAIAPKIEITDLTASTSKTTGAAIISGGLGVGGSIYAGNIYSNGIQLTSGGSATTYSISAETTTGGVNLRLTGSDATTDDVKLAAGSNITLTRTDASTVTIASSGGSGGSTDLSSLTQDILPAFDNIYDIGSATKAWNDVYTQNLYTKQTLNIGKSTVTSPAAGVIYTTADLIAGGLLVDKLLLTDNIILPDSSTAIQYLGNKGVAVISGNLDIQGDWLKLPVVESVSTTVGSFYNVDAYSATNFLTTTSLLDSNAYYDYSKVVNHKSTGKYIVYVHPKTGTDTSLPLIRRLNSDGTLDTTFSFAWNNANTNKIITDFTVINYTGNGNDGKIMVLWKINGGNIRGASRFNTNGSEDTTFPTTFNSGISGIGTYQYFHRIAELSNGNFVIGITHYGNGYGNIGWWGTEFTSNVVIFNSSLSDIVVQAPVCGSDKYGNVWSIVPYNDGTNKFLVSATHAYSGAGPASIARYNMNGTLDTSFSYNTGAYTIGSSTIYKLRIAPDGSIFAIGNFWYTGIHSVDYTWPATYGSNYSDIYNNFRDDIIKLNSSGVLQSTPIVNFSELRDWNRVRFSAAPPYNLAFEDGRDAMYIDDIIFEPTGKIIFAISPNTAKSDATGTISLIDGIVIYNADGTLDKTRTLTGLPTVTSYESWVENYHYPPHILYYLSNNKILYIRFDSKFNFTGWYILTKGLGQKGTTITTTVKPLTTGQTGMLRYNKDTASLQLYNGTKWANISVQS